MKNLRILILAGTLGFLSTSCTKETIYIYEVNDQLIQQVGADKERIKQSQQYISIAYSDLFGRAITPNRLSQIETSYASFGDIKVLEDLLIRNFLREDGLEIPSIAEMHAQPVLFIKETYKKFYGRDPNEYELWQWQKFIDDDPLLDPEWVYYAFLTSDEYRFY